MIKKKTTNRETNWKRSSKGASKESAKTRWNPKHPPETLTEENSNTTHQFYECLFHSFLLSKSLEIYLDISHSQTLREPTFSLFLALIGFFPALSKFVEWVVYWKMEMHAPKNGLLTTNPFSNLLSIIHFSNYLKENKNILRSLMYKKLYISSIILTQKDTIYSSRNNWWWWYDRADHILFHPWKAYGYMEYERREVDSRSYRCWYHRRQWILHWSHRR